METQVARCLLAEHPVEGEGVEVDVQVEPAAEALDHGEGAGVAVTHAALAPSIRVTCTHLPCPLPPKCADRASFVLPPSADLNVAML